MGSGMPLSPMARRPCGHPWVKTTRIIAQYGMSIKSLTQNYDHMSVAIAVTYTGLLT
jgi:hypothetical protein